MKALVIGRHAGAIPGVEIVELRPINFPSTADECAAIIRELWKEVEGKGIKLLFQNLPGQVGVACAGIMRGNPPLSIGVVISAAGPRPAGVQFRYDFPEHWDMTTALQMVQQTNPNCKAETEGSTVTITVLPSVSVLQFGFDSRSICKPVVMSQYSEKLYRNCTPAGRGPGLLMITPSDTWAFVTNMEQATATCPGVFWRSNLTPLSTASAASA